MNHVLTVTSADEVSGITIFDDGTKVYWGEGRSSSMIVVKDDERIEIPVWKQSAMGDLMQKLAEEGLEPQRMMTAAEEAEFEQTTGARRHF